MEHCINRRCKLWGNVNARLIVVYRGIVKVMEAYMGRIPGKCITRGQIVFVDTSGFMLKIDSLKNLKPSSRIYFWNVQVGVNGLILVLLILVQLSNICNIKYLLPKITKFIFDMMEFWISAFRYFSAPCSCRKFSKNSNFNQF